MPKHIAGKTFYAPDEVPENERLTDEEKAHLKRQFDAYNATRIPDHGPYEPKTEANRRFWDDTSGTEYENWTYPGDDRPPLPPEQRTQ